MAGDGKRWFSQFYDYNSNVCSVNIYDTEYTGTASQVTLGPDPVVISWMSGGDDKYVNFKPSEAVVSMMSTTWLQYLPVFAYTNKRFYVTVVKSGTVVWRGYSSPSNYVEPFDCVPFETQMGFVDGLGLLKNIQYTPIDATSSSWRPTLINYISRALKEIGHGFDIFTATDLEYLQADGATWDSTRPLEGLYVDYRSIRNDDGSYRTWFEVLEAIIKSLQARLYQCNGKWIVEHLDQKKDTYYRADLYDEDGVWQSTTSLNNNVIGLTAMSAADVIRFIHTPATLEISPAQRSFTISQNYEHRQNLLNCNNWAGIFFDDDFNAGVPRYWTANDEATARQIPDENALQINNIVTPATPTNDYLRADDIDLHVIDPAINDLMLAWFEGSARLHFKIKLKSNMAGDQTLITNAVASMRFILNCSGTNYYISYNPEGVPAIVDPIWTTSTSDGYLYSILSAKNITDWYDIDIVMTSPPAAVSGVTQTYVKIQLLIDDLDWSSTDGSMGTGASDGLMFKNVQIYFDKMLKKFTGFKKYTDRNKWFRGGNKESIRQVPQYSIELNEDFLRDTEYLMETDNTDSPDEYLVTYGDTEPVSEKYGGYEVLNKFVFYDLNGVAINRYRRHSDTTVTGSLLFDVNKTAMWNTYQGSLLKLNGAIIDESDGLSFQSILEDYDEHLYCPIAQAWSVKNCILDGEWLCISSNLIALQAEDFTNLLNEDGTYLIRE